MSKLALPILGILVLLPLALAHVPEGTPKNFCEQPWDIAVHDHVPSGWQPGLSNVLLGTWMDGNQIEDCTGDTIPGDFDFHSEFAVHGAVLLTPVSSSGGWGALACYGETPHHPAAGPVTITGATTAYIGVDYNVPCGDFSDDIVIQCTTLPVCTPLSPGADGAHHVYVTVGVPGHVIS